MSGRDPERVRSTPGRQPSVPSPIAAFALPELPDDADGLEELERDLGPRATTSRPPLPADVPSTDQPRLKMRQRLARLGGGKSPATSQLEPLFTAMRVHQTKIDSALIERAYRTAAHFHEEQTRKSGDSYITHPLAVATILAGLGMTEPTLVAALLHDTLEDTPYTLEALREDFGDEVASRRHRDPRRLESPPDRFI